MPSLADSLEQLSHQSAQIQHLSALNSRPAGPFVQAYLHLPSASSSNSPSGNVLGLIRDAQDSEVRLFRYIGESDDGGDKRVEKREGVVVTPLREMRGKGKSEGRDEVDLMLRTALKLVDDYRPMPRARAHISDLLDAHQRQVERIADLERLIAESSNPTTGSSRPTSPAPKPTSSPIAKPKLSPDEAIKAEEDALKKLEASILPLRQMTTRKPSQSPSLRSPTPPTTEHSTADQATYTPAKTPIPHVTNSLVNGTTPHRAAPATSNRFSPLRFLGTPRAPTGQPSGLRSVVRDGDDAGERRPIFARGGLGRSTSSSNARPPISEVTAVPADDDEPGDDDDAEEGGREEDTVRLHVPSSIAETGAEERAIVPPSPERTGDEEDATVHEAETVPQSSPARVMAPGSPEMKGPKKVEGVKIELESVKAALAKIWSTMSDLMRQGVPDGKSVGQDMEETIKHLHHLSQSDPPPPPSPSSASTRSSLSTAFPPSSSANTKPRPVNNETIITANLLLLLLRSTSDASLPMNEVKEGLAAMIKARGWEATSEGAEGLGTKVIYAVVGKKVVRIDRRGGVSGRLRFAE